MRTAALLVLLPVTVRAFTRQMVTVHDFPTNDPCLTSPEFFWEFPIGECSGPCGKEGCWPPYDRAEVNGTHVIDRYYNTSDCKGDPAYVDVFAIGKCSPMPFDDSRKVIATVQKLSVYGFDLHESELGCSGKVKGSSVYGLDVCKPGHRGVDRGSNSIMETCVNNELVQFGYSSLDCTGDFTGRVLAPGDCSYSEYFGSITITDVSACKKPK